ncbi:polysaccharide deacetylase family protein [Clostridium thermarum]|uniref:polysaccharide deacetylase family protein n=1 Tax=Clostridium thermarum TaxID=1716543 RepID=UPI0013D80AA7|nr:polysaccharide deacetylase family protein [Clostridium thermarum]
MNNEKSLYMLYGNKRKMISFSLFIITFFIISMAFAIRYFSILQRETGNSVACLSPFSVFPSDDEKNIGIPEKRNNQPLYPKEVYLTFDDGPTKKNTTAILDILEKNDIRATFFIIGELVEKNSEIIKRMRDSGMAVLPHCYIHNYSIYKTVDEYFHDLNRCIEAIQNVTGESVPAFIRMPGGSDNSVGRKEELRKIREALKDNAIRYVDWNVSSMDASANVVDMDIIVNSVISRSKNKKLAVVLMHDANSKVTTVEALPEIIRFFKDAGFVFRTFKDITEEEEREMIKRRIIYK